MTSNQIAYVRAREEKRHNEAMEGETYRSNVARETENIRANDLNYAASIYASQASMYNAKLNYDASVYATQTNASVRTYEAQLNAWNQQENRIQTAVIENNRLGETVRHNKAEESIERSRAGSSWASSAGNVLNSLGGIVKIGATIAGLMA